jgi:restriction endonuclease
MTEDLEEPPTTWETYEQVSRYLLEKMGDTLGLGLESVEGKQKLVGKSGMEWEIEGKGVKADGGAIVVIECRRYTTSKVKAEAIGGLAYRIGDLGAAGGILVTPIGVQQGGEIIAKYEGIEIIQLDADSTLTTGYLLRFLDNVIVGPGGATLTLTGGVPNVTVAPAEPNE